MIGLGSNLSPRHDYLRRAVSELEKIGSPSAVSSLLETEPWGVDTEKDFLNRVIVLRNCRYRSAKRLLMKLLRVENKIGRDREANAPDRVIDIDILYWGQKVCAGDPVLPHPRLHKRKFVLRSLVEVAPHFRHPVFRKTQRELLNSISGKEV